MPPIQPIAVIFLNEPTVQESPSSDLVKELYGLTPAEARLTAALLKGERLQEYSKRVGIQVETARSQLKQVFAKTGHRRQTDLIRELLSNPILRLK